MKKLFVFLIATILGSVTLFGQSTCFIKKDAALTSQFAESDSVCISLPYLSEVYELSDGGSTLIYYRVNLKTSVDVKEQVADSSWTFATFDFTLLTNDTLDSISINGVRIVDTVYAAGNPTATANAIADSINADTTSPDYTATNTDSTITIQPASDSTSTPNGLTVAVLYEGTATPTTGVLSGGFYRKNILTMYGDENELFEVTKVGLSTDVAINKSRVSLLTGDAPTTIWYQGATNDVIEVSDNRGALQTTINALP